MEWERARVVRRKPTFITTTRSRIRDSNGKVKELSMTMSNSQLKTPVSVLTEGDLRELELVKQYGATDVHINAEEVGWHPWVNGLMIKPYRYETKNGQSVFVLWAPQATVLGKHRHRGVVTAVTLEGDWGYFE